MGAVMFDLHGPWLGCAFAACLALPAAAQPAEPLAKGAKLCLHPLSLPFSESEAEARRPELERRLVDALAAASFEVAESPAVGALEQRVREEMGGFVDPALGVRDPERYRS
jgi:hypothetical protein